MIDYMKKYCRNSLLVSLLVMIFGIVLIAKPTETIDIVLRVFAILVLLDGAVSMYSYFKTPKEMRIYNMSFVKGVIEIVFALIALANPTWISKFFPIIVGGWIVATSVIRIQFAFNLKAVEDSKWWAVVLLQILVLILGLLIIFNPLNAIETIVRLAGVILLSTEIINMIENIIVIRRLNKMD